MTDLAWFIFFTYQPVPDLCVVVAMASLCHSSEMRGLCFLKLILLKQKCLKNLLSCVHWQIVFLKSIIALKKIMVNFEAFGRLNKHKNLISEECVSQFFCLFYCLKNYFVKLIPNPFYRLFLFFPGLLL